jgi:hypothetical protein
MFSRCQPSGGSLNIVFVPSAQERLASLEGFTKENRRLIEELAADIHGGGSVEWAQSVRGRLHHMAGNMAAADRLMDALRTDIAQREKQQKSRQKRWQWAYLATFTTAAALAPYLLWFFH